MTLQSSDTGVSNVTNTDANGDFTFLNVRIGKYTLRAEAPGFKAAVASEFTVTVSARQRVDLSFRSPPAGRVSPKNARPFHRVPVTATAIALSEV